MHERDDNLIRPAGRPAPAPRVAKPPLKRIGDAMVHARLDHWIDKYGRFIRPIFLRVNGACEVAVWDVVPTDTTHEHGGRKDTPMFRETVRLTLTPNQWTSMGLARKSAPRDSAGEVITDWHCEPAVGT